MEQILSEFGVQPILLAAQVVNFLVLLFILKKLLYKPILGVLEKRKQTIAQSLKNAEEIEKKLAQTEADREKALIKASDEAKEIIAEATKSGSLIIAEAHERASKDIEEMLAKGQSQINQDREKMQQEIREELADLVVVSLEKIVGKSIKKEDQKKIIDQTLKDI